MFPGRYSEIFGLGERLGCILNFGHSFGAVERVFLNLLVCRYARSRLAYFCTANASYIGPVAL